jgi:hypothetical protein
MSERELNRIEVLRSAGIVQPCSERSNGTDTRMLNYQS